MDDQHREYRDEIAAYSLDALEPDEAARVQAHLAECDACREYLSWLDPALDMLPVSVAQRRPPRGLKKSLMAEVREDLRAANRAQTQRQRSDRSGFWAALWRPATAAVACLVLVAGAIGGYALRGDSDEDGGRELIAADGVGQAGTEVEATLEVSGDSGTLHVERLPALPGNRVYQAWIQRDGRMEPSTPFVIKRDGSTEVAIDGSLDGASGIYITREPEAGSEVPTLPVVMKAVL